LLGVELELELTTLELEVDESIVDPAELRGIRGRLDDDRGTRIGRRLIRRVLRRCARRRAADEGCPQKHQVRTTHEASS
jgi:hypothetical protein